MLWLMPDFLFKKGTVRMTPEVHITAPEFVIVR